VTTRIGFDSSRACTAHSYDSITDH
jgi:hypothetical protein